VNFLELIDSYSPPEEFSIILPRGEVFVFRGVQSAPEWEVLQREGVEFAKIVRKGSGKPEWVPFKGLSLSTLGDVHCMERTMAGFYENSAVIDGQRVPDGERRNPMSLVEWLTFAQKAFKAFDAIASEFDGKQLGLANKQEERAFLSSRSGSDENLPERQNSERREVSTQGTTTN
jgi:hypothetical protein